MPQGGREFRDPRDHSLRHPVGRASRWTVGEASMEVLSGFFSLFFGALFVLHGYIGVKFHELPLKGGRRLHGRTAVVRGWIHIVVGVLLALVGIGMLGYSVAIKIL